MVRSTLKAFVTIAASALTLALTAGTSQAQSYPDKAVRVISPYAPGGATDVIARLIAKALTDKAGGSFIVENRPGAGTNIGTESVIRSAPDGYTLLLVSSANAVNATLYKNLKYNFINDMDMIGSIGTLSNVLLVHPTHPSKTAAELISYMKTNPGKLNMGLPGLGSPQHLSAELFKLMTKSDVTFVQYTGGGPVMNDAVAGHVAASFGSSVASIEYIKSGHLRALGVTGGKRLDALPDVPSIGEVVPGYEAINFYGLGAPKGTPRPIIEKLNKALNEGLAEKEVVDRLAVLGVTPEASTPAEFSAQVVKETEKWRSVIQSAGISLN